jgi:hypothetical protein
MSEDDEIKAMGQIATALTPLDELTRTRVLQWATSRFSPASLARSQDWVNAPSTEVSQTSDSSNFDSFAELFEAAGPTTDREKALVASYWQQVCQGQPSFGSQTLNDALKDLGHGVSNITDALTALKEERPAFVLQLKKSGTSKQARKTYKLTQEGIRRVRGMISRESSSDSV